jgi:hypothetical protein
VGRKATGPIGIAGLPKQKKFLRPWSILTRAFYFGDDSIIVRNYIINKIICLQYQLRKVIGKKMARWGCILIEKAFTTLFGREVYHDEI